MVLICKMGEQSAKPLRTTGLHYVPCNIHESCCGDVDAKHGFKGKKEEKELRSQLCKAVKQIRMKGSEGLCTLMINSIYIFRDARAHSKHPVDVKRILFQSSSLPPKLIHIKFKHAPLTSPLEPPYFVSAGPIQ